MPVNLIVLLVVGSYWGGSFTLTRIVMSEGAHPLAVTFWQSAGSTLLVGAVLAALGRLPRIDRRFVRFALVIGFLGGAAPAALLYWAAAHIGAGVLSVAMATSPLMQVALTTALGIERFRMLRAVGVALGLVAVWMIADPGGEAAPAFWVAMAVLAAAFYTVEGSYIAVRRPPEAGAAQVLLGMTAASTVMTAPMLAFVETPFPFDLAAPGRVEYAFAAFILGSPIAYGGFVWLIGRAGPVFAAQVAYVVTVAGVFAGVIFLGEGYGAGFWGALAIMLAGLALGLPGGAAARLRRAAAAEKG